MSTLKVEVVEVEEVLDHPNADRLEIVKVKGWYCVVGKEQYNVGDLAVYFPIDSIIPQELEEKIFGPDSKIRLSKSRVRTIKIRQAISQGLLVSFDTLGLKPEAKGSDLTSKLGVTKFEPTTPVTMRGKQTSRKETNPYFFKYTDIENYKNYPNRFVEGEEVVVTCKIHGSSERAGWVPCVADTWWKKVKQFFGLLPEWDFVYGSRNVQLHNKFRDNIYAEIVDKYNLKEKLKYGECLYGEVYGDGIQKGYTYGCGPNERKFVAYDLKRGISSDGQTGYVDSDELFKWCEENDVPHVPVLYRGPFNYEKAKALTEGDSVLCPEQKVREGVVIKPEHETYDHMGRKVLKLISDEYLLNKENTDFH